MQALNPAMPVTIDLQSTRLEGSAKVANDIGRTAQKTYKLPIEVIRQHHSAGTPDKFHAL